MSDALNDRLSRLIANETFMNAASALRAMAQDPHMLDLGGPAALIRAAEAFESAVRKS